jgi:hypothetical protein
VSGVCVQDDVFGPNDSDEGDEEDEEEDISGNSRLRLVARNMLMC